MGTFMADGSYMWGLNVALLPSGRDYSSFHELTYKGMIVTAKSYACTVATMLRFMEVNNPYRSKFEGLAMELESTRASIVIALAESEKIRKVVVKAEDGRLKAEDVFKNKECELQLTLVVSGKADEDLKATPEAHDQASRELLQVCESHEQTLRDLYLVIEKSKHLKHL